MPQVVAAAGTDGLPSLSRRIFQLLDQGQTPWQAVYHSINEYIAALVHYLGNQTSIDIGEIGR